VSWHHHDALIQTTVKDFGLWSRRRQFESARGYFITKKIYNATFYLVYTSKGQLMSKKEHEFEEQRSKLSMFNLLTRVFKKQELYFQLISYEQSASKDYNKRDLYPVLKHDKRILTVLNEIENQRESLFDKDGPNIENATKINEKLDNILTEKFYGYIKRGDLCSRSPSNPEEIKSKMRNSISSLSPLEFCVYWGGNK
jgi:hypothetical protein